MKAFAILKNLSEKTIASTGFAVLISNNAIPNFIFIVISSDFVVNQIINKIGEGAYPCINTT